MCGYVCAHVCLGFIQKRIHQSLAGHGKTYKNIIEQIKLALLRTLSAHLCENAYKTERRVVPIWAQSE